MGPHKSRPLRGEWIKRAETKKEKNERRIDRIQRCGDPETQIYGAAVYGKGLQL